MNWFLTGFHRSGTSAVYYDLTRKTQFCEPLPPARPLSNFLKYLGEIRSNDELFLPKRNETYHFGSVAQHFIKTVYGRTDNLFLKSTDFIDSIDVISDLLPEVRWIILIRDPVMTVASLLKVKQSPDNFGINRSDFIQNTCFKICNAYNLAYQTEKNRGAQYVWINFEKFVSNRDSIFEKIQKISDDFFSYSMDEISKIKFDQGLTSMVNAIRNDNYWSKFVTEYSDAPLNQHPTTRTATFLDEGEKEYIRKYVFKNLNTNIQESLLI